MSKAIKVNKEALNKAVKNKTAAVKDSKTIKK